MNVSIELSTVWRLWPLVTWEWFYCGYEYCERCYEHAHYTRREITVLLQLPFATLRVGPGIKFKTRVAIEGCPNKRPEKAVAA